MFIELPIMPPLEIIRGLKPSLPEPENTLTVNICNQLLRKLSFDCRKSEQRPSTPPDPERELNDSYNQFNLERYEEWRQTIDQLRKEFGEKLLYADILRGTIDPKLLKPDIKQSRTKRFIANMIRTSVIDKGENNNNNERDDNNPHKFDKLDEDHYIFLRGDKEKVIKCPVDKIKLPFRKRFFKSMRSLWHTMTRCVCLNCIPSEDIPERNEFINITYQKLFVNSENYLLVSIEDYNRTDNR